MNAETAIAMSRAGYHPPVAEQYICKLCGAVGYNPTPYRHKYFCKRHQFYVHSHGMCPQWQKEKYEPPQTKKQPFVQDSLF